MENISSVINSLSREYNPVNVRFFQHLQEIPSDVFQIPEVLEELYLRYQAGMHATRVMVYFLPHLNTPALRTRKLQIYIDDDGLSNDDTHHAQLRRAFVTMGARLTESDDSRFGDLGTLSKILDARTGKFVETVETLYSRSLGAWCITENFSDEWLHALADGLAKHCPEVRDSAYFADCFRDGVEERHGEESLTITDAILAARPELVKQTLGDARIMADALQDLWAALDEVLVDAENRYGR